MKTLFGTVDVANPRWNRCACQSSGPKTFRPAAAWLRGTTSPELLYLETKWASLIPFAKVADLLRQVLPADADDETIRRHLDATAERMEEELGEERQLNSFEREPVEQQDFTPPDGPITVGIDGGYVRKAHKEDSATYAPNRGRRGAPGTIGLYFLSTGTLPYNTRPCAG